MHFALTHVFLCSCRPSSWPFWVGFTGEFVIVYVVELFVFVTTLLMLCAYYVSKDTSDQERASSQLSHIAIAAILYLFFGVAWVFVLISTVNPLSTLDVASQYIYAFFFAFHSILLLILHALRTPDTRAEWRRGWYTLTCRRDAYHVHLAKTLSGPDSPVTATYLSNRTATEQLEGGMQLQEAATELAPEFVKRLDTGMTIENEYVVGPTSGEMQAEDDKQELDKLDTLKKEDTHL